MTSPYKEPFVQVAKVLVLDHTNIALVKQYRRSLGCYTWELPGGRMEADETLSQTAYRELKEETGLTCGELISLGSYTDADRRVSAELFFSNQIVARGEQGLEPNEQIEVRFFSIDHVCKQILQGSWQDSRLVCAFMLAISRGFLTLNH